MSAQLDFFNAVRVNTVAQGVYDPRLNPQPMVWSKRIPSVPAWDDEIMARFEGFPLIADVIVDDAKAVTYQFGKFEFYSSKAPKLKVGATMNERTLRQARRLQQGLLTNDEVGVFRDWERRTIQAVRYGVDVRHEALLIGMLFDSLDYDRLGIKLSGLTWQMYSDLKITVGTTWNNTAGTGITDIQTTRRLARIRYGASYNRLTMTTQDLLYLTAQTEFQTQSKFYVGTALYGGPVPATPIQNDAYLKTLAERILGGGAGGDQNGSEGPLTIELDDRRYWTQDSNGKTRSLPLHPPGKVILSDSRQDGTASTWDWGQGENIESVVASLAPNQSPLVPAIRGPVTFPTLTAPDLNSPGITYWSTETGFPRKHNRAANAVLTVGTYADTISDALPF
jgi:hypothetical protein